jgi:branched-chain amino acid transport system permease protein
LPNSTPKPEFSYVPVGTKGFRTKFLIYFPAAGATGSVGVLISMQKLRISPDAAFSVNDWTALVTFIVVIGGIGRMEGPLIGAIVFFLLRGCFADLGPSYLMLLGAFAIIITLTMPKGIAGLLGEKFDLDPFRFRRRVCLPRQQSKDSALSASADDRKTLEGTGASH